MLVPNEHSCLYINKIMYMSWFAMLIISVYTAQNMNPLEFFLAYLYLTKFQTDAVALVASTEAKAPIICFIGPDKIDQLKVTD